MNKWIVVVVGVVVGLWALNRVDNVILGWWNRRR